MRTKSYRHRGGKIPLTAETIDERFRSIVSQHAEKTALLSCHQGLRLSYRELDGRVEELGKGLLALQVERGDRVAVWATNHLEWLLLQLATARVGAVLVNLNPAYRSAELNHALKLARVQYVFSMPSFRSSNYVERLAEICPEAAHSTPGELSCAALPELRRLIVFNPMGETIRPSSGWLCWDEVIDLGRQIDGDALGARGEELDCDDPINIQFTSGTTGSPKAVVLTHHNILNNALACARAIGFGPSDKLCISVPFYHCFGMVVSNLGCLATGAELVLPAEHFEPGACLDAIEEERCTAVHGVPTMFVSLLEALAEKTRDLSSLRTGIMAGAPCPPELVRAVVEDMGCRDFLVGYGQTESSPVSHLTDQGDSFDRRVNTVGTNLPHQEVKVVDPDTGAVQPLGVQGEICFRGYHVMRGYYAAPEATSETIDAAGWLHSGDLGVMDEDGYLRITGRLKDMIIRGGENVYPAEIEAVLFEHDAIEESAVFGVPDERMGEEIGAWVKCHAGCEMSPEEVRTWIKSRMAHYKVPRYVWFVEEFPMTVTGKIRKVDIRETAKRWVEEEARIQSSL